ncbi:MAG: lipopolysaccharide heptosyltransferase I [Thermodesulfovibrionales bacterium]|nr:lipopolysaccharide heptosyltransferase I [Thermodesulfovibrionales bacterium]
MFTVKNPDKILIVKPSSLGDIVHSLPFLNAIRGCFPESEIHWVVAKGFEGLLEEHPMIGKLWIIQKDQWKKINRAGETAKEITTLFRKLRKEHYDLVVDLQGLLRSGLITAATGAPTRVGFREAREGSRLFYTHKVEGGRDIHAVDRYLKIAHFLGCPIDTVCFPFPPSVDTADIRLRFTLPEEYAVLVPGARWATKRWAPENFGKLASRLQLKSVIVGSRGDMVIAQTIVERSQGNAISLIGKTGLKELVEIMRNAKFVVSNDSGPMHIAAALGIPVFALFGPTEPRKTGPYGIHHTVLREEVPCAPCLKRKCNELNCMRDLSVGRVSDAITRKVSLSSPGQ